MSMTVEKKGAVQNGIKRAVFAGLAIILQILMIYFIYFRLETRFTWIANIITILAVLLVLYIYGRHEKALRHSLKSLRRRSSSYSWNTMR